MQSISLYTTNVTLDSWKYAWRHVPKKPSKLKVIPRIACMQGGTKTSWHIHLNSLDRDTHSSIISCVFTTTSEFVSIYLHELIQLWLWLFISSIYNPWLVFRYWIPVHVYSNNCTIHPTLTRQATLHLLVFITSNSGKWSNNKLTSDFWT